MNERGQKQMTPNGNNGKSGSVERAKMVAHTECICKNCIDTNIEARGVCSDCYGNGCDQKDGSCDR